MISFDKLSISRFDSRALADGPRENLIKVASLIRSMLIIYSNTCQMTIFLPSNKRIEPIPCDGQHNVNDQARISHIS